MSANQLQPSSRNKLDDLSLTASATESQLAEDK
jgi:hypothetical protein